MKKMLVLILVLVTVSVANAGISAVITGSTAANPGEVNVGDVVTIALVYDPGFLFNGGDIQFNANGTGVVNVATMTQPAVIPMELMAGLIMELPTATNFPYLVASVPLAVVGGGSISMNSGYLVTATMGNVLMSGITFTATSVGTLTIDGFGGGLTKMNLVTTLMDPIPGMGAGETFASINVVVPEPMTIALLGLGGLFLRRRK